MRSTSSGRPGIQGHEHADLSRSVAAILKVMLWAYELVYARGAMRHAEPCKLAVLERRMLIVSRWVTVTGNCPPPRVDRFVDRRAG